MWDKVKKRWGIRHLRYYYHTIRFNLWWNSQNMQAMRGMGLFWSGPNERDLLILRKIREGEL